MASLVLHKYFAKNVQFKPNTRLSFQKCKLLRCEQKLENTNRKLCYFLLQATNKNNVFMYHTAIATVFKHQIMSSSCSEWGGVLLSYPVLGIVSIFCHNTKTSASNAQGIKNNNGEIAR